MDALGHHGRCSDYVFWDFRNWASTLPDLEKGETPGAGGHDSRPKPAPLSPLVARGWLCGHGGWVGGSEGRCGASLVPIFRLLTSEFRI
jgi:hypothetical protein